MELMSRWLRVTKASARLSCYFILLLMALCLLCNLPVNGDGLVLVQSLRFQDGTSGSHVGFEYVAGLLDQRLVVFPVFPKLGISSTCHSS